VGLALQIYLPNSANLQNITALLAHLDTADASQLTLTMHPKFVAVHPVVLAMTACLAAKIRQDGGQVTGTVQAVLSLPYLIRMGLFDFLAIDPGKGIVQHDESGRFIPITQIRTTDELKQAIINLVPLLHAPPAVADPIKYVFSEMVRNSLEHSQSDVGVFVSAQYYKESGRIAIGIADAGIGVLASMERFHPVTTAREAITLALQPGITGTTGRIGGNEFNAGAGLFFTKSIATVSRNRFFLYSGDCMFRLMKTPIRREPNLQADPLKDPHQFATAPAWPGTVVAIDLNVEQGVEFSELLDRIRAAYFIDIKTKKDYAKRIRFS
jgi:anti-sigma regulatory factor (Ser/Thr protein kinase)